MSQQELNDYQDSVDHTDPEVLERLYHGEGLSLREIGDRAGAGSKAVWYYMDKHGIECRSKGEATREANRVEYASYVMDGNGYCRWSSQWRGRKDHVRVCRLLAVAEYGFNAVRDKHVHHKNSIPWLDYADNIELKTPEDHIRDHHEAGPNSTLSEEEARQVKQLALEGDLTQREIGERYGVRQDQVSRIKNGKQWKHLE